MRNLVAKRLFIMQKFMQMVFILVARQLFINILPILKQAEIVSLNGAGEALASKHGKKLIKAIAEKYPDIKFELRTNGILCCKKIF